MAGGYGFRVVASSIADVSARIKRLSTIGAGVARTMGDTLEQDVRQNMSLTDHSPEELAALDHPYARRHGSIQIHGGRALVHTQSGELLDSLKVTTLNQYAAEVRLDEDVAPHVPYVVLGTDRMIQRDVIGETAASPNTQRRIVQAAAAALSRALSDFR